MIGQVQEHMKYLSSTYIITYYPIIPFIYEINVTNGFQQRPGSDQVPKASCLIRTSYPLSLSIGERKMEKEWIQGRFHACRGAFRLCDVLPSPHLTLGARASWRCCAHVAVSRLYTPARIATDTAARTQSTKNLRIHSPTPAAEMAAAAAAGAVTVAACATAVLALITTSSSSNDDEARSGATVAPEVEAVSSPAPPRECAVCLSELPTAGAAEEGRSGPEPAAVRALPACGHAFHADCIGRWLPLRPECPLCRRPVLLGDGQRQAVAASSATPAPPWARPARGIACGFGDGRVVWTRSPSARQ